MATGGFAILRSMLGTSTMFPRICIMVPMAQDARKLLLLSLPAGSMVTGTLVRGGGSHMAEWENRVITPLSATHPDLGRWLWAMEDTRARTKSAVEGVSQEDLDSTVPGVENSIGTLLYHIALIEADYLCDDILGMEDYFEDLRLLLQIPDRDDQGQLFGVTGVPLAEHLTRLDIVRTRLLEVMSSMTVEQFRRARSLPQSSYDISPEWTLHHLMQHEGEHRGQIMAIREMLKAGS
jgi:uncharacterized damage-inducible protein DinB